MGSLGQASCGQAGGGAARLLMLGPGPSQGKHSSEAFPTTCQISQPSLRWLDSWQPLWGSERYTRHLLPEAGGNVYLRSCCAGGSHLEWKGGALSQPSAQSPTSTPPSPESETQAQETV